MSNNHKNEKSYKTIGELTKELGLVNKKTGLLQTHTIRYWETQFKQIKPTIRAGRRRYYSTKDLKIIKYIKFLLKDRGLTINGVKKILNTHSTRNIDANTNLGVYKSDLKATETIKNKIKNISRIVSELRKLK